MERVGRRPLEKFVLAGWGNFSKLLHNRQPEIHTFKLVDIEFSPANVLLYGLRVAMHELAERPLI